MKKLLLLAVLIYAITACQKDTKLDIEAYYLPLEELRDGMVYEYEAINNDSLPPYTWHFQTLVEEGTSFLVGLYYDHANTPKQYIKEEKLSNGMLLTQMFLYEKDSLDRQLTVPVEVLAGNSFPFRVQDSLGVFLYKVQWQLLGTPSTTSIIRNRRYMGEVNHKYEDKIYECIEFSVREVIDNEEDGSLELELVGIERYAKGVGLVYTERKLIGGNFEQKYQLVDRYAVTEE